MTVRDVAGDLRHRLASFVPATDEEGDAVSAVLAVLDGSEPFAASRFDPGHVTGSAFVLHPSYPAIALIHHSKIGRWLQPGGHVEPKDPSILAAALREVREEIGVGPIDEPWLCDVDVHVFPARHDVPRHLHHDVRVAFTADSTDLVPGDGADDVRWWSLVEATSLDESIARPARKLEEWCAGRN